MSLFASGLPCEVLLFIFAIAIRNVWMERPQLQRKNSRRRDPLPLGSHQLELKIDPVTNPYWFPKHARNSVEFSGEMNFSSTKGETNIHSQRPPQNLRKKASLKMTEEDLVPS